MMAELMGKKTGYCRGKGGSMHVADADIGILGATAVVASGIPLAVGAGLSCKIRKTDQVVACFFGDGASNNGTFHEGLNMAGIWNLPVIFVCENNQYAMGTNISYSSSIKNIADRASSYGIPGLTIDGNSVTDVYNAAQESIKRARKGEGPTLIECKTYRQKGHSRFDSAKYRPEDEVARWMSRDPLIRFRKILFESQILSLKEAEEIDHKILVQVEKAARYALDSPYPAPIEALEEVFIKKDF